MLDTSRQLKEMKAKRVFICCTFGLFTNGLDAFDNAYEKGWFDRVITTNLTWQPPEEAGVWEQVAALPARERLILYLYYYQGYSTGEIAQLLGESPGTLRSHLSRARKALKLRLEAEGYGPS